MTVVVPAVAGASRMRARAHVRTELQGGRTRLEVLRSQAPLSLRPTIPRQSEPWARFVDDPAHLCMTAAAAGPLGGDELVLEVEVGAGSALVLTESSATLVLPGHDGAQSRMRVRARVAPGGAFVWLPQPVIAAAGCDHLNDVAVELAPDAQFVMREQLLLGRKDEDSGHLRQRVRVRRDGRPLLAQDLDLGSATGSSPAVAGPHRAVGSLLVVDPRLDAGSSALLDEDGAVLPLAGGGAVLVNALAADNTGLRRQLGQALALIGEQLIPPAEKEQETP